ncbi:hypothetical protein TSUD_276360 [Trifolium subterraneum]|uniref:Uncharacterized protein n=1 Tax=Trifolium subterraneum TaxID=3900 RepID=A0A2Z6MYZ8_TRISU|nr:hypothetical protein TSUD_276360 [Trifolium subterraneum]
MLGQEDGDFSGRNSDTQANGVEGLNFPLMSSTTICRGDYVCSDFIHSVPVIYSRFQVFPFDSTSSLRTSKCVNLSSFLDFRLKLILVADDPRTTPSKFEFEENFPEDLFTDIEIPGHADWEVRIPGARQRICSTFKNGGFPMYQIAFEHMVDDEGRVEHRDDGEPIEVDCERFPFCWSMKHYAREAKSFTFRKGALSTEELADLKALEEFVEEFPPSLWEDREGNPICDEEGYQFSYKRFINTKALLKCSTRTEAEDLLCEMKNTQLTLRKLQAEKKRREAGGTSSSTLNTSAQSSPSKSIDLTGEKRAPEAAPVDKRPPKVSRTEAGGGSVVGSHRLVPGRPAEEFVIPPAMGHDCMLDEKTRMKISDADQTILASMGPESIRNVVAESSVVVFKLLEVATFLNGRECRYLQERDEARAHAKGFGERLTIVEKDLSSETKTLKESQAKVAQLEKNLLDAKEEERRLKDWVGELEEKLSSMTLTSTADEEENKTLKESQAKVAQLEKNLLDAKEEERRLKDWVGELEEKLSSMTLTSTADEEENKVDPAGTYANFTRAGLISKIYEVGNLQLEVASSSFKNALAQLQILNPGVQLVTEGMDEMKEVRDGQIATPPLDEDEA